MANLGNAADQAAKAFSAMRTEPAKRELYYAGIMAVQEAGAEGIGRFELEIAMENAPEAKTMYQPMGVLVDTLVKIGAIDEEAPEPEFDEATQESYVDVTKIVYKSNDVGQALVDLISPTRRFADLLEANDEYRSSYAQLLDFCSDQPRTRSEIDELLDGVCKQAPNPGNRAKQGLYPSYFTDGLQGVGAIAWNDGWTITEAGKACLEICR